MEQDKAARSIKRGSLYFMLFIIAFTILDLASGLFFHFKGVLSVLLPEVLIWIAAILFFSINKINPLQFMRVKRFHIGSAFLVVFIGILLFPVTSFFSALSMIFFTNEISTTMYTLSGSYPYPVALLLVALLPALGEEITCRGIVLNSFDTGRPIKAILVSALAFGAFHMNFNQFSYAFVIGLIMALAVEATDSIWSSVIIHFVFNGTSTTFLYLMPKFIEFYNKLVGESGAGEVMDYTELLNQTGSATPLQMLGAAAVYLIPAMICLVLIGLLLYAIACINNRESLFSFWVSGKYKEERRQLKKIRTFYPTMIIALVLCLLMAVLVQIL